MSQSALLTAYRDALKAGLGNLNDSDCEVMADGRPPATAGRVFYAVHPGSFQNRSPDLSLDEFYGLFVTVSLRGTDVAFDRWGPELLIRERTGLCDLVAAVRATLNMNYTAMRAANKLITMSGTTQNGFEEPLQFQEAQMPAIRGGDWWFSDPAERQAGLSVQITFGNANRCQTIEDED